MVPSHEFLRSDTSAEFGGKSGTDFEQARGAIAMDFELSDDQRGFQATARAFATDRFAPNAARWDEERHFPVAELREAAALGFAAIYVGEEFGGSGLKRVGGGIIFEELAAGCTSSSAFLTIHNMACWMIDRFGNEAQRRRFLPDLCRMDRLASYCLTEPGSGSDAASLKTSARREGDHYVVTGTKAFISGGGRSDLYLVMLR